MKKIKYLLFIITLMTLAFLPTASSIKAWKNPVKLDPYVQETEEFRAAWVASVFNLDIKQQKGTSENAINEWKAQYLAILDTLQSYNMNAVVFQIRPANDAFYPSKYNPWSEFLVGYGVDPGWDPLKWMIEVTHERGIQYHAWLNPYRVTASTYTVTYSTTDPSTKIKKLIDYNESEINADKDRIFANKTIEGVSNPIFATGSQLHHNVLLGAEGKYVLNPAADETIEHLKLTIEEIVDNYDIDGIHFDDYFYPDDSSYGGTKAELKGKTFSVEPYVEMKDYNEYLSNGGDKTIYDWRRENVNELIKSLSDLIREKNESKEVKCAFGISPAARWAPSIESCGVGNPRGVKGGMDGSCNDYYSYSDLYADTYKWAKEEWIDYILPQNYTNLDGNYIKISRWWSTALGSSNTKLYIGTPSYQIDTWGDTLELYYQIRYNQSTQLNVDGYCMYDYTSITEKKGLSAMLTVKKALWKMDALTPLYAAYTYDDSIINTINAPVLTWSDTNTYNVKLNPTDKVKGYEILSFDENADISTPTLRQKGQRVAFKIDTDGEFILTTEPGKKYIMVAYNESNKLQDAFVELTLPAEPINEAPVITNISKINAEYLINEEIKVDLSATDPEGKELTYTVYIIERNEERVVATGTIPTSTNSVSISAGQYLYTFTGQLKVVVEDGKHQVEQKFDFAVVNEYTQTEEPTPDPEPAKKGCKKKSMISLSMLISLSTFVLLLRKKDE